MLTQDSVFPLKQTCPDFPLLDITGAFGKAQLILCLEQNAWTDALDALKLLFLNAELGLHSDYLLVTPLQTCRDALALCASGPAKPGAFWEKIRDFLQNFKRHPFPQEHFIMQRRLKTLYDYERLRLNGLSLYLGERLPVLRIKDSIREFQPGEFFAGAYAWCRDLFYDTDTDEFLALQMYRLLMTPDFIPSSQYPPGIMIQIPRKYRLARAVHQDLRDTIDYITSLYASLDDFQKALELLLNSTVRPLDGESFSQSETNPYTGENIQFTKNPDRVRFPGGELKMIPSSYE